MSDPTRCPSKPKTGGPMFYFDSDGRLLLARERAAQLARDYGRRRRSPEQRKTQAATRGPRARLRLVRPRESGHESAGA